jgi:hypothetical protein
MDSFRSRQVDVGRQVSEYGHTIVVYSVHIIHLTISRSIYRPLQNTPIINQANWAAHNTQPNACMSLMPSGQADGGATPASLSPYVPRHSYLRAGKDWRLLEGWSKGNLGPEENTAPQSVHTDFSTEYVIGAGPCQRTMYLFGVRRCCQSKGAKLTSKARDPLQPPPRCV